MTPLSERREHAPDGAQGGSDGAPGENVLLRDGGKTELPAKVPFTASAGAVISVRSPGGWGVPKH